jgi:hypothetical protein
VIVPAEIQHLRHLLRDRARPLRKGKVRDVVWERPDHSEYIDPMVAIEALVLGRHHRVAQDRRNRDNADRGSAGSAQPAFDPRREV